MQTQTTLQELTRQIHEACRAAGRAPAGVRLLAVSKTREVAGIRAVMAEGQRHFGENYLQEALEKTRLLPECVWHFIGAIQSNKTRAVANNFSWVHTVAGAKVARRLSEQRSASLPPLNVLIQVNVSREPQKAGVRPDELGALVDAMADMDNLALRGLMTILEARADPAIQRAGFRELRLLQEEMARTRGLEAFDQLSMGMTADFPAAISEGATWIRIGAAIFGPRQGAAPRHSA